MIKISPLSAYRNAIPRLAALHYSEWAHVYPEWSVETAVQELTSSAAEGGIPCSFVAHVSGDLAGSVSLFADGEVAGHPEITPFLVSLYVVEEYRGRGLGRRLARHAVATAAGLGVKKLYLISAGQEEFYRKLGWQAIRAIAVNSVSHTLMACDPKSSPSRR